MGVGRAESQSRLAGGTTTTKKKMGAHPEHEVQLVLPGRPVAHRREHPAEVLEVQVLEHLRDPRRQGRDGELGYGHQLVLADVPLVPLVQRSEALVKALDLAAVELAAAVLLHLLDIVLGQVQARRRESLRAERRGGDRSDASVFFTLRLRDRHEAGSRRARVARRLVAPRGLRAGIAGTRLARDSPWRRCSDRASVSYSPAGRSRGPK